MYSSVLTFVAWQKGAGRGRVCMSTTMHQDNTVSLKDHTTLVQQASQWLWGLLYMCGVVFEWHCVVLVHGGACRWVVVTAGTSPREVVVLKHTLPRPARYLWPLYCCGLRPQRTMAAEGRKEGLCELSNVVGFGHNEQWRPGSRKSSYQVD